MTSSSPKLQVRCPKCASSHVRYSYTQSTWDLLLDLLFSMDAYRCRNCRARFHKFDPGYEDDVLVKTDKRAVAEEHQA
jgi:DNA-directed RNA polymerase subunit RPC12/RpoP